MKHPESHTSWYLLTWYLSNAAFSQDFLVHRCCESSFCLSAVPQTACCHTNARSLDRFCWDWLPTWGTRRKCRSRDRTSHNKLPWYLLLLWLLLMPSNLLRPPSPWSCARLSCSGTLLPSSPSGTESWLAQTSASSGFCVHCSLAYSTLWYRHTPPYSDPLILAPHLF